MKMMLVVFFLSSSGLDKACGKKDGLVRWMMERKIEQHSNVTKKIEVNILRTSTLRYEITVKRDVTEKKIASRF